ncbi:MAG TPA: NAD(P)H-hydrate dehydratase [Gemmatimonadaceae bacterium]
MRPLVRVVTSAESAGSDAETIRAGVPSRALMQRAGAAAAGEIALRLRDRLTHGVLVFAGPGNNGGDAWVVARALATSGVRVRVIEPVPAKTVDATAERALTVSAAADVSVHELAQAPAGGGEQIIVDGLLGTGSTGESRGGIADAIAAIARLRERGAVVVALDVPSALDATSGAVPASDRVVSADLTLTFGAMKRGLLVARKSAGAIAVLDIGLNSTPNADVPRLIDEAWVAAHLPSIAPDAHKGTRKKLALIGGAPGMAGAAILAARAALRSGVGMVKLVLAPESLTAAQQAEPQALGAVWPTSPEEFQRDVGDWADAIVIGPGLGRTDASRSLLELVLAGWKGPTVLDADAITLFEGRSDDLASRLSNRRAVLTPHPVEFSRLAGMKPNDVLDQRFDVGRALAARLGATILLKGVPTVIFGADGTRLVSATGTPLLATGGSGDVLSGIIGTLVAQLGEPTTAAAIGAWIHGRAAERVPTSGDGVRGPSLDEVLEELREGWSLDARPTRYPVLVELPPISAR